MARWVLLGLVALAVVLGVAYEGGPQPAWARISALWTPAAAAPPAAAQKGKGAPAPLVKLAAVQKIDIPLIQRAYGTVLASGVASVNSRIASQITRVLVVDGQDVKAGDTLVTLDDRSLQAALQKDKATLAKDQAALANAEAQMLRAKTLAGRNAGTLAEVDTAVANHLAAEQVVNADQSVIDADQLQLGFATVTAPISGKLGTVNAVVGNLVATNATTPLMTITALQPLKLSFRVPESVLPPVRTALDKGNAPVVQVLESSGQAVLDQGKLSFIDSSVDVASGTIGMAATLANEKFQLWPGQQVAVQLTFGQLPQTLVLPTVAIQQGQIGSFVWAVDADMKVKATPVKVVRYEGDLAALSDGIAEGTQVVIEGQAKLNDGMTVRTGKPADPAAPVAQAAVPADAPPAADAPVDTTKKHHKKQTDPAATGATP